MGFANNKKKIENIIYDDHKPQLFYTFISKMQPSALLLKGIAFFFVHENDVGAESKYRMKNLFACIAPYVGTYVHSNLQAIIIYSRIIEKHPVQNSI